MSMRTGRWMVWLLAVLFVPWLGPACKDRDQAQPAHDSDSARNRRRFRPPPDQVRPVPPHVIHESGVGPYELGMALSDILNLLPHGPRVVLAQIDGVVYYNLVRADDDRLVIGVTRPRGVVFVSVLEERIARTEDGVGVGTSLAQLRERMGPVLEHRTLAMDPRMVVFARLPGARFVLDTDGPGARVVAVDIQQSDPDLLRRIAADKDTPVPASPANPRSAPGERGPARKSAGAAPPGGPGDTAATAVSCGEPRPADQDSQEYLDAAQLPAGPGERARVVHGCFAGQPMALVEIGSRIALVGGEDGKPRKLAEHQREGLLFAAPLDVDDDRVHEIALVYQSTQVVERERERVFSLELLRHDTGRLHVVASAELYRLSTRSVAWIGAGLDEIELLLELTADGRERVHATGLFMQWNGDRPSNLVQLLSVDLPIRLKRPRADAVSGGASDTGTAGREDAGVRAGTDAAAGVGDDPSGPGGPGDGEADPPPDQDEPDEPGGPRGRFSDMP